MPPHPSLVFLPNGTRARIAAIAIGACAALQGANGVFYAWLLATWGRLHDATAAETLEGLIGLAMIPTGVAAGIAFLFWFRRAYGNAHALGLRGGYGVGWSIGGWFVPFLNLVRPAEIASSMWRHAGRERAGPSSIVFGWWAAWLLGNIGERVAGVMIANGDDQVARFGIAVAIGADATAIVAGVLAIVMIRRLTAAHETMVAENGAEAFA